MSVNSVHLAPGHGFSKYTQPSINLLLDRGVEGDAHCGEFVQHLFDQSKAGSDEKINFKQVHLFPFERLQEPTFRAYDRLPVLPGDMGENITTEGIDLHALGEGTRLHFVHPSCLRRYTALKRIADLIQSRNHKILCACFYVLGFLSLIFEQAFACIILLAMFFALSIIPVLARDALWAPVVRVTGLRQPCKQIDGWRDGLLKQCYSAERAKDGRKKRRAGVMGIVEKGGELQAGMTILLYQVGKWKEMICV